MAGLVVAAARSGSGKTVLTLALLRAFRKLGLRVASAKIGPDFIDPRYHEAATGRSCINLDGWAMRPALLHALAAALAESEFVLVEGVMGLFDAAEEPGVGAGSTAEIAKALGLPVLLVLDTAGMGQSIAALAAGFQRHDTELRIAGIVLNNVASDRHQRILLAALAPVGIPVLAVVPRDRALARPSRHLGLVQAGETDDLEGFLERAASIVTRHADLDGILAAAASPFPATIDKESVAALPPLGQRIAVASDVAFSFAYPHVLDGWRKAAAEITAFSPLADEAPDAAADAVFLPGGYPELHAGQLAAAARFRSGLAAAAGRGAAVYGECGGYMALGQGIVDAEGSRHAMAGLLGVETSFVERTLCLGYRHVALTADGPLGEAGDRYRAHEFHYSAALEERGSPLFRQVNDGKLVGLRQGRVMGSYLHLIDRSEPAVAAGLCIDAA
jgi:cobyrinic acid a,c-diamide synthase